MSHGNSTQHELLSIGSIKWNRVTFYHRDDGQYGVIFINSPETKVIKCFYNPDQCKDEYEKLKLFTTLVPEYSPSPISMIKTDDEVHLGILMSYAGKSLYDCKLSLNFLEKTLAILQYIYVVLSISDKLKMEDVNHMNLCIWKRYNILRLRVIDCTLWIMKGDDRIDLSFWYDNCNHILTLIQILFGIDAENFLGDVCRLFKAEIEHCAAQNRHSHWDFYVKTRRQYIDILKTLTEGIMDTIDIESTIIDKPFIDICKHMSQKINKKASRVQDSILFH